MRKDAVILISLIVTLAIGSGSATLIGWSHASTWGRHRWGSPVVAIGETLVSSEAGLLPAGPRRLGILVDMDRALEAAPSCKGILIGNAKSSDYTINLQLEVLPTESQVTYIIWGPDRHMAGLGFGDKQQSPASASPDAALADGACLSIWESWSPARTPVAGAKPQS